MESDLACAEMHKKYMMNQYRFPFYVAPHRARLTADTISLSQHSLDATFSSALANAQCPRHWPRPWQQFSTEENAYSVASSTMWHHFRTSPVRPSAQLLLMVAQATTGHS